MSTENEEKKCRFLVIRTDRIGDVVLATSVLTALKCAYPSAHVAMLVRPDTLEIVSGHPDVDEILIDEVDGIHRGVRGALQLARTLRACSFDTAVVLHPTFRLACVVFLAGIKKRVGTLYRAYSFLFNERIRQHRKNSDKHELDLNLDMVRRIGARLDSVEFKFNIPNWAINRVRHELREFGIRSSQKLVVFHPGSGGSARDWPLVNFSELADRLIAELHAAVVVTGGPREANLVDEIISTTRQKPFRLDGRINLKELAALLQRADLLVANSTGPLHMAVAVGTQVIGLYCPIRPCLPQRWGPYGHLDSVIMPEVDVCEKCIGSRCRHFDCMEKIEVDRVFSMAKDKLKRSIS